MSPKLDSRRSLWLVLCYLDRKEATGRRKGFRKKPLRRINIEVEGKKKEALVGLSGTGQ